MSFLMCLYYRHQSVNTYMIDLLHILVFACVYRLTQVRKVIVIHTVPETNSKYAPQTDWQIDKSSVD